MLTLLGLTLFSGASARTTFHIALHFKSNRDRMAATYRRSRSGKVVVILLSIRTACVRPVVPLTYRDMMRTRSGDVIGAKADPVPNGLSTILSLWKYIFLGEPPPPSKYIDLRKIERAFGSHVFKGGSGPSYTIHGCPLFVRYA